MAERAVDQEQQEVGENPAGQPQGFSWPMLVRVLLGTAGCYAMAAVVAMGLARGLAVSEFTSRSEATAAATVIGMLVWPCATIWVFAAASLKRIAIVMGGITALSALIAWVSGQPT